MAYQQLFDRYESTVNSAYTAGGTSLVVANATGLPSEGNFYLLIEADSGNTEEVFLVTSRSGTTCTGTGAHAGTSASNHGIGSVVRGYLLFSDAIEGMFADAIQSGAFSSLPASGPPISRAIYQTTGSSPYRLIWNGSAWVPYGPIFEFVQPSDSGFSWVNQGTSTLTTTDGDLVVVGEAATANNARIRIKTAPATPYTITVAILVNLVGTNSGAGLLFRNSGAGTLSWFSVGRDGHTLTVNNMNSPTSFNAQVLAATPFPFASIIWLQISDDGTNRIYRASSNGKNFRQLYTVARTTFLTPDQIGFFVNGDSATVESSISVVSWLQA